MRQSDDRAPAPIEWSGHGYLQMPAVNSVGGDHGRAERLDADALADHDGGRWNGPGEPTLYLASDVAVALSEYARHLPAGPHIPEPAPDERLFVRVALQPLRVLDLRDPAVAGAMGAEDAPNCFADQSLARRTARRVRRETDAQAILTQPMAFLDRPGRWNLVVFVEKLPHSGWAASDGAPFELRLLSRERTRAEKARRTE